MTKFAEASNETAGEHFTPRDIVRLTTSLVFALDDEVLTKNAVVRRLYDPTAGTGGFLSSGSEYIYELNPNATLVTFSSRIFSSRYSNTPSSSPFELLPEGINGRRT